MLATIVACAVVAQTAAPPKVPKIASVERGAYVESNVGFAFMLNSLDDRTYGFGTLTGVFAGYDVLPILSVGLGAQLLTSSGSVENNPRGDLLWLMPMLSVQFALLTTERNFLWVRGQVGFALGLPAEVGSSEFGGNGPSFAALAGYERFTKLRHFSIGVQGGIVAVTKPGFGIAISVVPTLKYTF